MPKLKTLFWNERPGASSTRAFVGSLIYGTVILFLALGVLSYVTQTFKLAQEGAYKIERYAVNGVPRTLSAEKYGRDPMLYFEFTNISVLSLDGQNTYGNYTFDTAKQEFALTADRKNPDFVLKGAYQINDDEMTLRGKQAADDVEIRLRQVNKDADK